MSKSRLTVEEIDAVAHRAGYTQRVLAFSDGADFDGWVKQGGDFDDTVTLISRDDGNVYNLRGWLYEFERV